MYNIEDYLHNGVFFTEDWTVSNFNVLVVGIQVLTGDPYYTFLG